MTEHRSRRVHVDQAAHPEGCCRATPELVFVAGGIEVGVIAGGGAGVVPGAGEVRA